MSGRRVGAFFRKPINSQDIFAFINTQHDGTSLLCCDKNLELAGTCDSRLGGHRQFVFANSEKFNCDLNLTESLILIDRLPEHASQGSNQFCVVSDPKAAFIDALTWLIASEGIDSHWCGYSTDAAVSKGAKVSGSAIIEPGVEVADGSVISAGAVIKSGSKIGKNTVIRENVVVGCDGITVYRAKDGRLLKFPHVGGVTIGDNTEIGANVVISSGILAPTFIGNNVVIGNLCNVGHGAIVEDQVWMSVGSLLGGHTTVQVGATIAMGVSVRDNLTIGAGASLGMGSVVVKDVEASHSMFGNPAKRMPFLKTGPKR